jgi:hypothetical protein
MLLFSFLAFPSVFAGIEYPKNLSIVGKTTMPTTKPLLFPCSKYTQFFTVMVRKLRAVRSRFPSSAPRNSPNYKINNLPCIRGVARLQRGKKLLDSFVQCNVDRGCDRLDERRGATSHFRCAPSNALPGCHLLPKTNPSGVSLTHFFAGTERMTQGFENALSSLMVRTTAVMTMAPATTPTVIATFCPLVSLSLCTPIT